MNRRLCYLPRSGLVQSHIVDLIIIDLQSCYVKFLIHPSYLSLFQKVIFNNPQIQERTQMRFKASLEIFLKLKKFLKKIAVANLIHIHHIKHNNHLKKLP